VRCGGRELDSELRRLPCGRGGNGWRGDGDGRERERSGAGCGGRLGQRMRGSARQDCAIASSESAASWLPSKLGRHSLHDAPLRVPLVLHGAPVFSTVFPLFSTVTQFGHGPFSVHRVTLRFGETLLVEWSSSISIFHL
jgi:hypothetical protein